MTEENVPADARDDDDTRSQPRVSPPTASESNRELQDVSRRRRESEEKLQHHLKEAQDKPAGAQDGASE